MCGFFLHLWDAMVPIFGGCFFYIVGRVPLTLSICATLFQIMVPSFSPSLIIGATNIECGHIDKLTNPLVLLTKSKVLKTMLNLCRLEKNYVCCYMSYNLKWKKRWKKTYFNIDRFLYLFTNFFVKGSVRKRFS